MINHHNVIKIIQSELHRLSSVEKARSSRRYFPNGVNCIGANASDIKTVINHFHQNHSELSAGAVLAVSEGLLKKAQYSEEILVAFGLINKLVKNNYDETLLLRFKYWLENYASNWVHVDDLCIKTVYRFLMARPHLIEKTQMWSCSKSAWCRRASNVVWVKFIRRQIGSEQYCLDKQLVFDNCDRLIGDPDEFVQKSVGWLLKVTLQHHQNDVIAYITTNYSLMTRATIRYALEKADSDLRKSILSRY